MFCTFTWRHPVHLLHRSVWIVLFWLLSLCCCLCSFQSHWFCFQVVVSKKSPKAAAAVRDCLFHDCFDVYHCGYNDDNRISVHVYPAAKYVDEGGAPLTLPPSRSVLVRLSAAIQPGRTFGVMYGSSSLCSSPGQDPLLSHDRIM